MPQKGLVNKIQDLIVEYSISNDPMDKIGVEMLKNAVKTIQWKDGVEERRQHKPFELTFPLKKKEPKVID